MDEYIEKYVRLINNCKSDGDFKQKLSIFLNQIYDAGYSDGEDHILGLTLNDIRRMKNE